MALIFLSHSSHNNAEALALGKWLSTNGWNDAFLDLDAKDGLVPGDRWQSKLRQAMEQCEAVLLLLSPQWARSDWCRLEYFLARQYNKRIFGVFIAPTPQGDIPPDLLTEWQAVDLTGGPTSQFIEVRLPNQVEITRVRFDAEALERLKDGLTRAGLTPTFFPWPPADDPDRSPFPGLRPLELNDAGIFFGRDSSIIAGLDLIRGMQTAGGTHLLYVLGASGSGKSSFIRAGLLPRIERDTRHFHPFPVIRPERGVIESESGLIASLLSAAKEVGLSVNRTSVRDAVYSGSGGVTNLLLKISAHRQPVPMDDSDTARIVLVVDQAEELLANHGADEADRFLTIIGDLLKMSVEPSIIVIVATRTDSSERLQVRPELSQIPFKVLPLLPMPGGAYVDVIRGPISRAVSAGRRIEISGDLIEALLIDIEKGRAKDALPLLAFTLERLYRECAGDGDLRLTEYQQLGGIRGAIEAAVERALGELVKRRMIPAQRPEQLALLRRALIPWLAGIDPDSGSPRRRIARMSEIPVEARPIVEQLVESRLLSTDVDPTTREITVEPSHEALLRQWGLLDGWLHEDLHVLTSLEGLQRATRDWLANARDDHWLIHSGTRLLLAQNAAGRADLAELLTPADREYLTCAQEKEDRARDEKLEAEKRKIEEEKSKRRIASMAALILLVFGLVITWLYEDARNTGKDLAAALALSRAKAASSKGDFEGAASYAAAAFDTKQTGETRAALYSSVALISPHLEATQFITEGRPEFVAWDGDRTIAVLGNEGSLYRLTPSSPRNASAVRLIAPADGANGRVVPRGLLRRDDGALMVALSNGEIQVVNKGTEPAAQYHGRAERAVAAGPHSFDMARDGSNMALITDEGVVVLKCKVGQELNHCIEYTIPANGASALSFSPNGKFLAVARAEQPIEIFPVGSALLQAVQSVDVEGAVTSLAWRPRAFDSAQFSLAVGTKAGRISIETLIDAKQHTKVIRGTGEPVTVLRWSPTEDALAFGCEWDVCVASGPWTDAVIDVPRPERFTGHKGDITDLRWSGGGNGVASSSVDGSIRKWARAPIGRARRVLQTPPSVALLSAAYDSERSTLAAGSADAHVYVWDGAFRRNDHKVVANAAQVRALSWGPEGSLGLAIEGGALGVLKGGHVFWLADPSGGKAFSNLLWIDGDHLAALPRDEFVLTVFDRKARTQTPLGPIDPPQTPWGFALHPVEPLLFVSFSDGSIHAWNTHTWAPSTLLVPPLKSGGRTSDFRGARSIAIARDGSYFAASRNDKRVELYPRRPSTPSLSALIDGTQTTAVAFAPDGKRIAALDEAGTVYVWTLRESGMVREFAATAVPVRQTGPTVRLEPRKATSLLWISSTELAFPTSDGDVEIVSVDESVWIGRVSGLVNKIYP